MSIQMRKAIYYGYLFFWVLVWPIIHVHYAQAQAQDKETPAVVAVPKPLGNFDGFGGSGADKYAWGWTVNPLGPNNPSSIGMIIDGRIIGTAPTTVVRADVNSSFGITGAHGFALAFPDKFKDTSARTLQLFHIQNTVWQEMAGSPRVLILGDTPWPMVTVYVRGEDGRAVDWSSGVSAELFCLDEFGNWAIMAYSRNGPPYSHALVQNGQLVFYFADLYPTIQKLRDGKYKLAVGGGGGFQQREVEFEMKGETVMLPPITLPKWEYGVSVTGMAVNGVLKYNATLDRRTDVDADIFTWVSTRGKNSPYVPFVANQEQLASTDKSKEWVVSLPQNGHSGCAEVYVVKRGDPSTLLGYGYVCTQNPIVEIR